MGAIPGSRSLTCKWGHPRDEVSEISVHGRKTSICLVCKRERNKYYDRKEYLKATGQDDKIISWDIWARLTWGAPVKRVMNNGTA